MTRPRDERGGGVGAAATLHYFQSSLDVAHVDHAAVVATVHLRRCHGFLSRAAKVWASLCPATAVGVCAAAPRLVCAVLHRVIACKSNRRFRERFDFGHTETFKDSAPYFCLEFTLANAWLI